MTKQFCVARLLYFSVSSPMGRGDRIGNLIWLTNDREVVESHLSDGMILAFGLVEVNAIRSASMVAYSVVEESTEPAGPLALDAVLRFLSEVKQLQLALWLVKDNAISIDNAFLEWPHKGPRAEYAMNKWEGVCSDSTGSKNHAVFSREELRLARQIKESLWRPANVEEMISEPTTPELRRLGRALYFIDGARSRPALSLKVAHYCSAFEALLATTSTELSHKLAERVAWIVGHSPEERLAIFRRMKRAYGVRSKAVHGSAIANRRKQQEIAEAARDCDDLLRQLIVTITRDEELTALYITRDASDEEIEDVMTRKTMGFDPSVLPDERGTPR